jgi:hypothetical protein
MAEKESMQETGMAWLVSCLAYSSILKMEVTCPFQILVYFKKAHVKSYSGPV